MRPVWRQCFTDVGGADVPDWRFVLVRLKRDGTPDLRYRPRWHRRVGR